MKRDDMVLDVIRPIIEGHLVNVDVPENVESFIAFDVLTALEKAGMLPPKIGQMKTGRDCLCSMHEGCADCDQYISVGERSSTFKVSQWEE